MTVARTLRFVIPALSTLALGVTGCSHDTPRTARADTSASTATPQSAAGSGADAWHTTADSVMTQYLTLHRFGADSTRETSSLDDDCGGNDNATLGVGMARFRILGRAEKGAEATPDGELKRRTLTYSLELQSVVHMIPFGALASENTPPNGPPEFEYLGEVSPRVDTVSIIVAQTIARPDHWSICDLEHEGDRYTNYWDFIRHEEGADARIKWQPAGSAWREVRRLADSVGRRLAPIRRP